MPPLLSSETLPLLPSVAVTRLGTVCPRTALRLLDFGTAPPAGKTRTSVGALMLVTVTLRITAVALAGTGPRLVASPVTWTVRAVCAGSWALGAPTPSRVSRMRRGSTAVNVEAAPATTGAGDGPCWCTCASSPGPPNSLPARRPARSTPHRSPGVSLPLAS